MLACCDQSVPHTYCRGKVPYCTSFATISLSAKRESGTTGTVRHLFSTTHRFSGRRSPDCRRVNIPIAMGCCFNSCLRTSRGMWCLRHAGALAWRRGPVCACTRVCWCRRISTYIHRCCFPQPLITPDLVDQWLGPRAITFTQERRLPRPRPLRLLLYPPLPWRVFLGYPACIPPVSHLDLTVSLVSRVSLYLSIYI